MASGGLYFFYLHQSLQSSLLLFVYWTQLLVNTGHAMKLHVMDYISFFVLLLSFVGNFSPSCYHGSCGVLTVSNQVCGVDHLIELPLRTTTQQL